MKKNRRATGAKRLFLAGVV